MSRILVVEDESAIAELIAINLRHAGYEVTIAAAADQAQTEVDQVLPDLVVLDWMLPGQSGLALARRWRSQARTRELPIIMLTARAEEADKVSGLDAGADDYLVKPFSPRELLARAKALLRRKAPEQGMDLLTAGPVQLDPASLAVTVGGARIEIGHAEFKLLKYLMAHPDRAFTRAQLLDKVWGNHVAIEERTVDVHVKRLREALEPAGASRMIETVRGAGYRFTQQVQALSS